MWLGHWARLTCVSFSLSLFFTHGLHTLIPFNCDHLTFPSLALARLLTPQRHQVSTQRMVYVVIVTPIRGPTLSVLQGRLSVRRCCRCRYRLSSRGLRLRLRSRQVPQTHLLQYPRSLLCVCMYVGVGVGVGAGVNRVAEIKFSSSVLLP